MSDGVTSALLGFRVTIEDGALAAYGPDGVPFRSSAELRHALDAAESRASEAESRAERLAAALRAAGLDPDALQD